MAGRYRHSPKEAVPIVPNCSTELWGGDGRTASTLGAHARLLGKRIESVNIQGLSTTTSLTKLRADLISRTRGSPFVLPCPDINFRPDRRKCGAPGPSPCNVELAPVSGVRHARGALSR